MMSRVRWATGDEIVIDGPCRIASTIRLVGDRSYRGESRGTVLTQAAGANLAAMLASDSWLDNASTTGLPITLRDLTIDGNRAENPMAGDGLVIRSWLTLVENLTVTNSPRDGIRVTSLSRTGTGLTNTQVNGTLRNLFVTDSGRHGINIEDPGNSVTDWNLTDSWVASSGQSGIRSDIAAGWTIERNHVYGVGAVAIDLGRLFGSSVSDNYIEDFASSGIRVTVQGTPRA